MSNGGHTSAAGNPHIRLMSKDTWGDNFLGKDASLMDGSVISDPEDVMKAQRVVVRAGRALGYSNGESKRLLEQLGIAERVEKNDNDCEDSKQGR